MSDDNNNEEVIQARAMNSGMPSALTDIPLYRSFFGSDTNEYLRIHIHLIGIRSRENHNNNTAGIEKQHDKWWGRFVDAVADPFVHVQTIGDEDTGSTDYFPVGQHTFPVLHNCQQPLWDAKCVLLAKKQGFGGVEFTVYDENKRSSHDVLMQLTLTPEELPEMTHDLSLENPGEWTRYSRSGGKMGDEDLEFIFCLKVTDGADAIVTQEELTLLKQDTPDMIYSEVTLKPDASRGGGSDETDCTAYALLQCWIHTATTSQTKKAVLWILGRNDCFMHPHVAKALFFSAGYDLYVLNYSQDGACRRMGWVKDAHFNSHNARGSFDCYNHEIQAALNHMGAIANSSNEEKAYETVLGYAHSTGGPVLLNYLMEHGDSSFDGFIFNSPFLDWGFVGGDVVEFVLEKVNILETLGAVDMDFKFDAAVTPESLKDTPIHYLGQEAVISDWSARTWSLYHFDWAERPLYKVPMTGGFAKGVTGVHEKLRERHDQKRAITSHPFLCITSRGDDVLVSKETLAGADWIGPARCEIELHHNAHDIFLSQDAADTVCALDMVKSWMKCHRFN